MAGAGRPRPGAGPGPTKTPAPAKNPAQTFPATAPPSGATPSSPAPAGLGPTPPVRDLNFDRNAPQSPPRPAWSTLAGQRCRACRASPPRLSWPIAPAWPPTPRRRGRDSLNVVLLKRRSQMETTVKYAAKDSIQFNVDEKIAKLYSKASVDYGQMGLKAALITVNYGDNTVQAVRPARLGEEPHGGPAAVQGCGGHVLGGQD
ncbi:MAG: hypothetical protein WKG07_49475 [Hymenobacter sp.]